MLLILFMLGTLNKCLQGVTWAWCAHSAITPSIQWRFQYLPVFVWCSAQCYFCPQDLKICCPDQKEDVSNLKSHLHVPSLLYALPGCNGLQLEGCSLLLQIPNLTEPLIHNEDTADRKWLITHTIRFFCLYLTPDPHVHYFQRHKVKKWSHEAITLDLH